MRAALILSVLLLLVIPAAAQTFPPDLAGEQFPLIINMSASLTIVSYCPWSFPLDEDARYIGELVGENDHISVTLACMVNYPSLYCIAPAPLDYQLGRTFQWNSEARCYLRLDPRPDGLIGFEAWVMGRWDDHPGEWTQGCFDVVPGHPIPSFVFSPDCPLYTWWIYAERGGPERLMVEVAYE